VTNKKTCCYEGCATVCTFGLAGTKQPNWCRVHAPPEAVDVVNKPCCHPGCTTRAWYGLPGHAPAWCAKHRAEGTMTKSRTRCRDADCTATAIYGIGHPMACERHRTDAMVNLIEKRCASCGLMEVVDEQGRCGTCSPELFRRVRLAKQRTVQAWLDAADGLAYELTDRALPDARACGVYARPDFFFDAGGHAVILEVDEHQHRGSAYECERTRMVNLASTVGLPTVFVRFNPDAYKPAAGVKATPAMERRREALQASATGAWEVRLFFDGDDPAAHGCMAGIT
jgi:hypothetical protein